MIGRIQCPLCNRSYRTSAEVVEHIKKKHSNRLSKQSFEYLRSLGVPKEKILRFCEENRIKMCL